MSEVSIPGKVMLSGEYAVLHGGWSVLLPVPHQLIMTKADSLPAAGYPPAVAAALRTEVPRLAEHEDECGVPHFAIDRSSFEAMNQDGKLAKLGLGSSAAEIVATLALRYTCAGLTWVQHWREIAGLAIGIHEQLQAGLGSGADVAAVASRQPIRYQREGGKFSIESIPAPDHWARPPLHLAWTGQPADTRQLVKQFQDWYQRGGARAREAMREVASLGDECAAAWFSLPPAQLFQRLDAAQAALETCMGQAGVSYLLPAHQRMKAWAAKHGGRAKPTGAGGGDMVLLIGELPVAQLEQLIIPLDYSRLWPAS